MIIYHNLQTVDQNLLHQLFNYNDGELYWKIKPAIRIKKGDIVGNVREDTGYRVVSILDKKYTVHRLIFLYHHGYIPKMLDHIDGNKSNNKIENLRECNSYQNNQNAKRRKDNTSGTKGVYLLKTGKYAKNNKWMAFFNSNKKRIYLGVFEKKEDAENIIREYREKHHGEFTNHG